MRDIVATIQPEQDSIVRTELSRSVCIQGAPGTGKTAVGLHRAAYLLYAYRDQLARSGVLVVGPNDSFLSYIGDVLPALGEIDATQATVSSLVTEATGAQIRGLDTVPAALVKGDARMAEVLRRAVWSHLGAARQVRWWCRAGRTSGGSAATWSPRSSTSSGGRGVRYAAGRAMLPQRLAHQVLLRMEAAGRLPRRPGAERGGAQQTRQGVRRSALAGAGSGEARPPAADRRATSWPSRPRASSTPDEQQLIMMTANRPGRRRRPAGPSPT